MTTPARVTQASRTALKRHLERSLIAGEVATVREENLAKYGQFAAGLPGALLGLEPLGTWSPGDVLALMAARVGVSPDPAYRRGPDRIDADLTVAALERMADRLAAAARPGARILVATGHPAGLLPVHLALARGMAAAGAQVLTPAAGWSYETTARAGRVRREIRYIEGVATVSTRGELNHTHSPRPMRAVLEHLGGQPLGDQPLGGQPLGGQPLGDQHLRGREPLPDLAVADHGWAGAAAQAGITSVAFADSNDPALFVGEQEGAVAVTVPLDDNVAPHLYRPLVEFLLSAAGLVDPGQHPNG